MEVIETKFLGVIIWVGIILWARKLFLPGNFIDTVL